MKHQYTLLILLLPLWAGSLLAPPKIEAQAPSDALRNVQERINGTARGQALGGKIGALGADPTSVSTNPAGTALFTRSTFTFTYDFGIRTTSTPILGSDQNSISSTGTNGFGTFSYFSSIRDSWRNSKESDKWNFNWGFQINTTNNFTTAYNHRDINPKTSLGEYLAYRANLSGVSFDKYWWTPNNDPRRRPLDQSVVMGLNGGIIEGNFDKEHPNKYRPNSWAWTGKPNESEPITLLPTETDLQINEKGGERHASFTLSASLKNTLYLGGSFRVGTSTYTLSSRHHEEFFYKPKNNSLSLSYGNDLTVTGRSFGFNLGALLAVGNYGRVGISVLLPQSVSYKETYSAYSEYTNDHLDNNKPQRFSSEDEYINSYKMLNPGKLTLSGLLFLGRYGLLTYDYSYRYLGLSGVILDSNQTFIRGTHNDIFNLFGNEHSHALGLELRPFHWCYLRGGVTYRSNGIKDKALKGLLESKKTDVDYPASGMILHSILPKDYTTFSGGLGFSLSNYLSFDISYVNSLQRNALLPYSGIPELLTVPVNKSTVTQRSIITTVTVKF